MRIRSLSFRLEVAPNTRQRVLTFTSRCLYHCPALHPPAVPREVLGCSKSLIPRAE